MMIDANFKPPTTLCSTIRIVAALFIVGVLAIYCVSWLAPSALTVAQRHDGAMVTGEALSARPHVLRLHLAGVSSTALAKLDDSQRMVIAAVSLPYLVMLVFAFWRLDRLLAAFSRGHYFERSTVGHLRAFSGFLLVAKLLALAALHARSGLVQHFLGGQVGHVTAMNLSNDDLAVLLMCLLFFAIARIMEEGRRLTEENREFV